MVSELFLEQVLETFLLFLLCSVCFRLFFFGYNSCLLLLGCKKGFKVNNKKKIKVGLVSPDCSSEGGNGKCCMNVVSKCCAVVSSAVDTNFLFVLFLSLTSIGSPHRRLSGGTQHPKFLSSAFHLYVTLMLLCWRKKFIFFTAQASLHHLETKQKSLHFFF